MINTEVTRTDFPMLAKGNTPIYFDNACTTLKPLSVIEAMTDYYKNYSGCAGRSMHHIAKKTEEEVELARHNIAKFINARESEIVFTKNTTEAINLVANSIVLPENKNEIVTTIMEHHSAYLPFYRKSKGERSKISIIKNVNSLEEWLDKINKKTGIVVVHAINNTLGTSPPINDIVRIAHESDALILVDGAQSVPHSTTNFKRSDFDFLAFSGHKMLGPTGIGCLVAKKELLESMEPFIIGGGTIEVVGLESASYLKPPKKFEGGIQNYSGIIGLSAAVAYLNKIGMSNIELYEKRLICEIERTVAEIDNLIIYGSFKGKKSAIFTFNIRGMEPHQVTIMLDKMAKICTRSGVFCAQPAMEFLGAGNGAVRASLYFYNTIDEIEIFFDNLKKISELG